MGDGRWFGPVEPKTHEALAAIVREERARLIAALVRRYGFDVAETSVDLAVAAALEQWPTVGIPDSPRAWLLTVARRRALDSVRHRATAELAIEQLRVLGPSEAAEDDLDAANLPDDRLRLLFTCCHPAIAHEAQIALALRWLSGLSTEDVARAFGVPIPTMAQRLTRAKTKIEAAGIPYEIPERREWGERVGPVLEVIYAIFNEGYVATSGAALSRIDLALEAIHLGELVVLLLPDRADAKGLLALMLFIHARRDARVSAEGELVPLEEQDRQKWDRAMITRAQVLLREALTSGPPHAYAVEAAIQALHDEAPSYGATDFRQILVLYALLREKTDAAIVDLNAAVVRAMVEGVDRALADVLALESTLAHHPALHAAKAELYRRQGQTALAVAAYEAAIAATKNDVERRFLLRRCKELADADGR